MAKMTKTIFSKRIRKEFLDTNIINNIQDILLIQNEAKIKAYSYLAYNKEYLAIDESGSLHLHIKNMFGLNTYYANFAVTEAKWVINSNKEFNKYYIKNLEQQIKHKKDYLNKQNNKLKFWTKIKKYMVNISKDIKLGKIPKLKTFYPYTFFLGDNQIKIDCFYKTEERIYDFYLFEVKVVNPKIKSLKNKINQLKLGIQNNEIKLKALKSEIPKAIFGSKKLFKSRTTIYENHHSSWKEEFKYKRHKAIQLQGCKTATQGNYAIRYNELTNEMNIMLPYQNEVEEGKKKAVSTYFTLPNVEFTYNKDLYFKALNTKGSTISYRIEDYKTYYIIKATFDVEVDDKYINYSKEDGVIGYDINFNHIAYSETDRNGNLISFGTIPFNLNKKTSNQINKILEEKAIELVDIAIRSHKPLVGEDISKITNNKASYGNKKRNRNISLFAHQKIINAIRSRAFKEQIDVCYVNPAYTSQIGKLKYMKQKGISIHTSASYVIGRRGMGYKEKLKQYSKYQLDWKQLSKEFKGIWTNWLYKVPDIKECKEIKEYVKEIKQLNKNKTKVIKAIKRYEHKLNRCDVI